jgi:hypothetical protein
MQHSPSWETNRFVASQEIPRISRKLAFHYRTHKFPPPVSILGQINPVNATPSNFIRMDLNIILPLGPGLASRLFPSGFKKVAVAWPLLATHCWCNRLLLRPTTISDTHTHTHTRTHMHTRMPTRMHTHMHTHTCTHMHTHTHTYTHTCTHTHTHTHTSTQYLNMNMWWFYGLKGYTDAENLRQIGYK